MNSKLILTPEDVINMLTRLGGRASYSELAQAFRDDPEFANVHMLRPPDNTPPYPQFWGALAVAEMWGYVTIEGRDTIFDSISMLRQPEAHHWQRRIKDNETQIAGSHRYIEKLQKEIENFKQMIG